MSSISICTIYAKRKLHLQNLVESLNLSSMQPYELIIVCMNDELPDLPETSFKIKTATLNTKDKRLPLAEARNRAAASAEKERLVFLDVDCICHRDLVAIFNYHLEREDALYQGSVRYLASDWQKSNWTWKSLEAQSSFHSLQGKEVEEMQKLVHPFELFWSLCFGINKKTFFSFGGFDPSFVGYGAEDTDFAFTARAHDIPFYKISAKAYHQYHPSYDPPLNHLEDIVNNAKNFYRKWQIMPMKKWLDRFSQMGYLKISDRDLEIVKYPTDKELVACLKSS